MEAEGFDCILGNPPYLYSAAQEDPEYFQDHYLLGEYQTDYYVYSSKRPCNSVAMVGDGHLVFIGRMA